MRPYAFGMPLQQFAPLRHAAISLTSPGCKFQHALNRHAGLFHAVDERDPVDVLRGIAAMSVGAACDRLDQSYALVIAQRMGGQAATLRHFTDRQSREFLCHDKDSLGLRAHSKSSAFLLPHAINKVPALTINFTGHETMHVGFEARELFVEIAGEFQVVDDGSVEALSGNQ